MDAFCLLWLRQETNQNVQFLSYLFLWLISLRKGDFLWSTTQWLCPKGEYQVGQLNLSIRNFMATWTLNSDYELDGLPLPPTQKRQLELQLQILSWTVYTPTPPMATWIWTKNFDLDSLPPPPPQVTPFRFWVGWLAKETMQVYHLPLVSHVTTGYWLCVAKYCVQHL